MNQLTLDTLKTYAAEYPIVPVYKEIFFRHTNRSQRAKSFKASK